MFPAKWRQMDQQVIGNILGPAQSGDGAFEIPCVPKDDRGDEKIQAGSAMLLVLVGAITNFSKPVNEDRAGQAVACFAFIEFPAG